MILKPDVQGALIYAAMAGYLLTLITAISKPKLARVLFVLTFLVNTAAIIYRGIHVGHLPMQNMFEVFLFLGFCIGPIHWLSGKVLKPSQPAFLAIDAAIGIIVLFPAGFVFDHQPQFLPPALQCWLFGPHVAAYMLAYIFMAKAAVFAGSGLVASGENAPLQSRLSGYSYLLVAAGFPFLTAGLFLGSVWGKYAWGDWWGWDPKELWSLVCWLVYILYLHIRYAHPKAYRLQHALVLLGMVCIVITLLWVNLSKIFGGLHNYAS